jgi:hypothetical protein
MVARLLHGKQLPGDMKRTKRKKEDRDKKERKEDTDEKKKKRR